ncbi:MAG: hypothetical protein LBB04_00970, partial [Oscillospiraceae bacterium]|nr:hypothetical protein [Oscillospiraceae bacterium]
MNRRVNEKMRRKHWKKWVSRALASFVVACACSPARVWGVGHDITATVSTWDNLKDEITKATQEKGEQSITLSADIVIKESITVPAGLQLAIYLEDWDTAVSRKLTRGPSVPKEKPLFDVAPGGYLAICGDGFVDGGLTGHTATDWKPTSAAATGPLVRVAATGKFFAGGVEIRNNLTKGNGGAIDNAGEAVLASCDIHHCHALGAGGGIYNGNTGTLLLTSEIKIAEADLPYSWSWGAITIGNRSFIKCCTAWGPAPENGKPVFGGYGGCLCNSGTATVVAWHLDKGCAYGGGCVANFATLTLKAMEDVAQTHLAWGKAVPCVAGVTAPDRWGEGNLLWNKGTCFFEKVDLRYRLADNEGIPDIFEYGRNPLTLMDSYAIPDPIPTGGDAREHPLTFAGFYYEDDPGWSTPAMWKWGVDESGADNDFCFFNTNGKTLSNTQNARVLANDMPLILGADGHAKVPGTDKIYENMSRYTNREFVVGVARGKEVTGTVSCMLFEVFSCKRVTPEPTVRAWTPQSPTGDSLTNLTPSPISGYSKETKLPEDLRQRYLVTIPDSVPPGSYWLVLIEQQQQIAQAIGCTHLYLADVRAPDISPRIVLKGSNTAEQIVMQNGVYTYEEGTRPVIYFIVTDESGFNELKGGVAKIVLQRPGTAQPLTMANCLVSGQSVAVSYPVTVPGIYSFVAVDYAGNISNAVAFNLKLNDGAGAGAGAGNIINNNNIQIINSSSSNSASDAGGNTAGSTNSTSNNNSNSSNQDSSNASENSNN